MIYWLDFAAAIAIGIGIGALFRVCGESWGISSLGALVAYGIVDLRCLVVRLEMDRPSWDEDE
jgi:hypothetical protein